jgi:hypothetical protein
VYFFTKSWALVGERQALANDISNITGIDFSMLMHTRKVDEYSIAQRMSWASHRKAKRLEDQAYSLMGIFDINMPLLYGEGSKAFLRLQQEIIKISNDQSIFAWTIPDAEDDEVHGLLASSPEMFLQSRDTIERSPGRHQVPYSMSHQGLSITLPMEVCADGTWTAQLHCRADGTQRPFSVHLRQIGHDEKQYARIKCSKLIGKSVQGERKCVFVRQWHRQRLRFPLFFHLKQIMYLGESGYPESLQAQTWASRAYQPIHRPKLSSQKDPSLMRQRQLQETSPETGRVALLFKLGGQDGAYVVVMLTLDSERGEPTYDAIQLSDSSLPDMVSLKPLFQPQPSPFKQLKSCRVGVKLGEKVAIGATKPQLIPVDVVFDRSGAKAEAIIETTLSWTTKTDGKHYTKLADHTVPGQGSSFSP